jgi:hypothetical protein
MHLAEAGPEDGVASRWRLPPPKVVGIDLAVDALAGRRWRRRLVGLAHVALRVSEVGSASAAAPGSGDAAAGWCGGDVV